MFAVIGTVDNYTILPSPVLDDADPKGYHIEQRLQVTLKFAANERQQYTVEFRLGDESQAPSTDLLTKRLESGELVQAYCAGLAARPFVHSKEKTYQRRGRQVQVGDQTAELDAFVVFAGSAMAPLEPGSPLEEHGLPSLLEQSRCGGYLWVFFTLPQAAALVTGVVLSLLDPLYTSGQLPQVVEVYPDHTELGHAVRMPLGIHRRTGQRYPFLDQHGASIGLEDLPAAMAFALAQPAIRPEQLRAVAAQLGVSEQGPRTRLAASPSSVAALSSTTSAVIRWVDAQVNVLDLLEELAPATNMRLAGQGYLGWCPFHDDQAPDANGDPGTPSFYVVHNSHYGWSWRCLSTNCMHSDGPMRHSFRLFQEALQLDVVSAIGAALAHWPEAGG